MDSRPSALELRNSMLELMHEVDPSSLSPAELAADLKFLRSTISLLELQYSRTLAAFDSSRAYLTFHQQSTVDWLRSQTHVGAGSASGQLALARNLDALEPTLEAVQQGEISIEHAHVIAHLVKDLPAEQAEPAQAECIQLGNHADPGQVRKLGTEILHREDPDGLSQKEEKLHARRCLHLFDHADGMVGIEGSLTPVDGQRLRQCLASLMGVPASGDKRTHPQRQADALVSLLKRVTAGGLPSRNGRRAQLTVVVQVREDLEVEGRVEGVGAVSRATLNRLFEDDFVRHLQRVDGRGATLHFGTGRRIGSELQRLERSIQFPRCSVRGCDRLARDSELHHRVGSARGGPTDIENELPLCPKHHAEVSAGGVLTPHPRGGHQIEHPPGFEFDPASWRAHYRKAG